MPDPPTRLPGQAQPGPVIVPEIPPAKKPGPHSGKVILNPDGSLHIGPDGQTMIHDARAALCCEEEIPEIVGPCCLPDGTCIDDVTASECHARNGLWWPEMWWIPGIDEDTRCVDIECPGPPEPCPFCRAGTTPRAWRVTFSGVAEHCGCIGGVRDSELNFNINGTFFVPNQTGCYGRTADVGPMGEFIDYADYAPFCSAVVQRVPKDTQIRVELTQSGNRLRLWVGADLGHGGGAAAFSGAVLLRGYLPDVDCMQSAIVTNSRIFQCDDVFASWGDGVATVEPVP